MPSLDQIQSHSSVAEFYNLSIMKHCKIPKSQHAQTMPNGLTQWITSGSPPDVINICLVVFKSSEVIMVMNGPLCIEN